MSCEQIYIGNYEAYVAKFEELKLLDKSVIFLFCGSTEESTGDSWCVDCRNGITVFSISTKIRFYDY